MPAVCLLRVAVPMITAASVTILVIFAVVMCMDRLARYGRNRERRHWQFFHTEPQSFDFQLSTTFGGGVKEIVSIFFPTFGQK